LKCPARPCGLGVPTDVDYERQARGAEFQVLTRSPLDDMQLTWRGGYRWNSQRDTNPDSLLPDPNPLARLKLTQEGPMLEARLDKQLSSGAALLAGVAWYQQQTSVSGLLTAVNFAPPPAVIYTPFADRYTRDLVTGYADWEKRLDDRLWLLVGGRVAVASDANPVLLPRVRLRYKPSTDSALVLLTRPVLADNAAELAPQDEWASRSFGSPVVLDRGGYNQSYELQYELQPADGSSVRLTVFHRDLRNLLVSLEDPAWAVGAGRPELGKASVQGIEAEYERWLTSRLSGGVWVRWADADNRDAGFPDVPYEPSLRAQARLDYLDDAGWRVALIWNHVGRRWADLANTNRLGAFDTLDFSIARQFDLHTDAFIAVENLLDEEYQVYQDYPERGRRAYAGLRYRF